MNENDPAKNNKPELKSWSSQQRVIIYGSCGFMAIVIGLALTANWYASKLHSFQEEMSSSLVCRLYNSQSTEALKVLFLGNSLIYCSSLPQQFATIYRSNENKPIKLFQIVVPGETLEGHLKSGKFQNLLKTEGPWDVVVMQAASYEIYKHYPNLKRSSKTLVELIRSSGAKPFIFMTWADKGDFKLQRQISNNYYKLGNYLKAEIIPSGDLFFLAQKDYQNLELYQKDRHHPSALGSYIGALIVFKSITGKMPINTPRKIKVYDKDDVFLVNLNNQQYSTCKTLLRDFLENYQTTTNRDR